ncbi:MAG: GGDEF domain-containing protein [Pseudomonadota bacterium]
MARATNRLKQFFSPPDPALLEAGAGGAQLVAWTRLWFWLLVMLAPGLGLILRVEEMPLQLKLSAAGVVVIIVYSLAVLLWLRRRDRRPPSFEGYVTSTVDITLITLTLLLVALNDRFELVVYSQSAWAIYLLVIITSCLRFNTRICLYMGLMTIAQYAGLLAFILARYDMTLSSYDVLIQGSRFMLMAAATGLALGIVNRGRAVVRASGFDVLTGLATRRYFDQRFGDEIERARRDRRTLSLVVLDLDHFKALNDRYGHDAGDQVLKEVARLMALDLSREDFLARWGGEEFAVILPGASVEAALEITQQLAQRIRSTQFSTGTGSVEITISAGIAELDRDGDNESALFAAADGRVYAAKDAGRDRIVT